MRWPRTEEEVIAALQRFHREHGRVPSDIDWRPVPFPGVPGRSAIYRIFGSWSNAVVAAGFDALPPGDWRRPEQRDAFDAETAELARRHDAGETLAALGREAGQTGQSMGRRIRRWRDWYGVEAPPDSHVAGRPARDRRLASEREAA